MWFDLIHFLNREFDIGTKCFLGSILWEWWLIQRWLVIWMTMILFGLLYWLVQSWVIDHFVGNGVCFSVSKRDALVGIPLFNHVSIHTLRRLDIDWISNLFRRCNSLRVSRFSRDISRQYSIIDWINSTRNDLLACPIEAELFRQQCPC